LNEGIGRHFGSRLGDKIAKLPGLIAEAAASQEYAARQFNLAGGEV